MLRWKLSPAATIMAVFFIQALAIGGFFSRLAEMQQAMDATPAQLGLALLGLRRRRLLHVSVCRAADRADRTRLTLTFGLPLFALAVALVTLAPSPPVFFFCSIFVAVGFTFTAIAMNVEADRIENATGRRIPQPLPRHVEPRFLRRVADRHRDGGAACAAGGGICSRTVPVVLVASLTLVAPMVPLPPRPHSGEAEAPRFATPTWATFMLIAFALGKHLARGRHTLMVGDLSARCVPHRRVGGDDDAVGRGWRAGRRAAARRRLDRAVRAGARRHGSVVDLLRRTGAGRHRRLGAAVAARLRAHRIRRRDVVPQAMSAAARLGDRPASINVASISFMNAVAIFLTAADHGILGVTMGDFARLSRSPCRCRFWRYSWLVTSPRSHWLRPRQHCRKYRFPHPNCRSVESL